MKIFTKLELIVIILVISSNTLFSQNLFHDDFSYPATGDLTGVGGWVNNGTNNPNNISVTSPGLTYSNYSGSGIGNTSHISGIFPGDILQHPFPTQTTGSVYYAFMVRIDTIGDIGAQGYVTGLNQSGGSTNFNCLLYIHTVSSGTFNFGFNGRPGEADSLISGTYNTGTTYLVVIKYKFVSGTNNDSTSIFLFSGGTVPATEPAPAMRKRNTASGVDMVNEGMVLLNNSTIGSQLTGTKVRIDGIKIGTSWATSILSSLSRTSSGIPDNSKLGQNYPNPFNPVTHIEFSVPSNVKGQTSNVKLIVYDALGKEVQTLVNGKFSPGSYDVEFNGSNFSSGIYFYKLETENFKETKRMLLVK